MADIDSDDAISALVRLQFGFFLSMAFQELGGNSPCAQNWHIDAIVHQLDRVRSGNNRRLIVTMPPRHLKSRIISIAWVAWMLGHNPALTFLCVSYGQDLAEDHANDCLKIIQSRWYRRAFPSLVDRGNCLRGRFDMVSRSVGVNGSVRWQVCASTVR